MYVAEVRLINFRSYRDTTVMFGPGLNVVVGENAAGKTNLLEGAWFALRGSSPRTRREEKVVYWGERFSRVEAVLRNPAGSCIRVELGYAPREGKHMRWAGAEVASLEDLRGRSQVGIFVPESLLLVKGSPARRRAHLDSFAGNLDRRYARAVRDVQEVLRQRNAQLGAVKAGAPEGTLDAWDRQFAKAAVELGRLRRDAVTELDKRLIVMAGRLCPTGESYAVQLVSQMDSVELATESLVQELRRRRGSEVLRGLSLFGPQRDDLRFVALPAKDSESCVSDSSPTGGRDLRLYGSQGEQRLAVLALLLAEQDVAMGRAGEAGTLFLDDVMSELDDARRRLLVEQLSKGGQAIVTTTNRHYFTEDELARATVIELPLGGGARSRCLSVGGAPANTAAETPSASGSR